MPHAISKLTIRHLVYFFISKNQIQKARQDYDQEIHKKNKGKHTKSCLMRFK
jgi:hypothetical protein